MSLLATQQRSAVLMLYRLVLRTSEQLQFTDRAWFEARVRREFREPRANAQLTADAIQRALLYLKERPLL
ncbi:hypothetical protein CAOG_06396 [Capsaspora owczarzaki ATCC 30864]|uniref:hypothetical protein n=1 Tax=Capsaspora owczarzaki (strain ATCC 30864) TaxID=595528 RepID=UPI0001FE2792|nr:hypothetical protein CAOG_06396 [Capsaspora owczarzaki ATCC 30864]|eukprot:XP_004345145.1 hypothetical protein CAOG_06396 [Capsaspora owczarzaki ATCC 30864]